MSRGHLFDRILASLHASMFDDTRWPATSGLIDEFCGTKGNFLVFGDGAAQDDIDIFCAWFCFRGQRHAEFEREYFEVYHAVDERLPRIRSLPDSQLAPITSLLTEDEMKTSAVYNELMPRGDTQDSLSVRLDGPNRSRIVWSMADPVDGEGWSSGQVEAIERLLPHLRHFVWERQELANARALGASVVELLDNVRMGVIQLDRRGRVVAANDCARALLCKGDALSDEDGLLCASNRAEKAKLQELLMRALPFLGGVGASGSMTVSRAGSLSRLAVYVRPVSEGGVTPRRSRIGALVLVVNPDDRTSIGVEQVRNLLGLTPAESQVAVSLAEGKTIRDIMVATGRSESTIRWHIKHIYAKHGLTRQVELVQLLMSLAGVPEAQR